MNQHINIKFQEGTIPENGVNGCQIEDVIDVLVERLNGFQQGQFPCGENAYAIQMLSMAKQALVQRTKRRTEAGMEGKNTESPTSVSEAKKELLKG